jgi:molybdopterin molybdotransferase
VDRNELTGLVLAGGRGSRMGGVDKGLQLLDGRPLVAHAIERLAPQVSRLMISANRNLESYAHFGVPVWSDAERDFSGPLAGFLAGLLHCETEWMVTVPCDSPRFPQDLVGRLAAALDSKPAAIAVTHQAGRRQREPVFCLLHRSLRDDLAAYLREGGRKIDAWLDRVGCAEAVFDDGAAFFNANSLDELRRLAARSTEPAFVDVRMRGFSQRSEVTAALAWIDAQATPLPAERVPVDSAAGRVLAAELVALIAVPEFDRAAMDGYALRGTESTGAGDYNLLEFPVVGHALPGRPFDGPVPHGAAVRIMTGAPMPVGLDAVVPAEYVNAAEQRIAISRAVAPGQHVGHVGEDIARGSAALPAARHLRPQDLGLAASLGMADLDVVRKPCVRLLVTGNEVRPTGTPKGPYEIYDANSVMLRALVERDGGIVESHLLLGDDATRIAEALTAPGADVILVSGGSSVGAEDHAPRLVAERGLLAIHGVAMRPSSPAGMGRIGQTLVFLLPGNPVSCLCAYDFFAGRAIRRLGGRPADWPYRPTHERVARKIVSEVGRVDYVRVKVSEQGVEPLALSGASVLSSTTRADGFVVVPAESEGHGPGAEVTVYRYE